MHKLTMAKDVIFRDVEYLKRGVWKDKKSILSDGRNRNKENNEKEIKVRERLRY
jgi:hypothetical protein